MASPVSHELIHVRRRDWLSALGEQVILAMFWYHPAIWWLIRRIELAREQVVDRCVLELAIDRRQDLKSLLHSAADRAALLSANLFFTRHHLKERVALLLEEIPMSKTRLFTSLILVSMMLCLGAAIAAYAFPLTGQGAVPPSREQSILRRREPCPLRQARWRAGNLQPPLPACPKKRSCRLLPRPLRPPEAG